VGLYWPLLTREIASATCVYRLVYPHEFMEQYSRGYQRRPAILFNGFTADLHESHEGTRNRKKERKRGESRRSERRSSSSSTGDATRMELIENACRRLLVKSRQCATNRVPGIVSFCFGEPVETVRSISSRDLQSGRIRAPVDAVSYCCTRRRRKVQSSVQNTAEYRLAVAAIDCKAELFIFP